MGVFKRNKTWYVDYTVIGKNKTKRRIREAVGSNKADAIARLGKVMAAVRENRFFDIKKEYNHTFDELVKKYKDAFKNQTYFRVSKKFYLKVIEKQFKGKMLSNISAYDIEMFRNSRKEALTQHHRERKDATVNREMQALRHLFSKAVEWEMMEANPFDKLRDILFEENNQRLRFLEENEITRLIDACRAHLKPIVICAINTGMRLSEILTLRWDQIRDGLIYLTKTKSKRARQIPINGDLQELFDSMKTRHIKGYVFCKENGERYSDINGAFRSALRKAKITDCHFHDLRHTFASHWVMRGGSLKGLQEILGHSSITMTMRYSHLSKEFQREEIKLLEGLTCTGTRTQKKQI